MKLYENIVEAAEARVLEGREVRVWFSRDENGPDELEDWVALKEYVYDHRKDEVNAMQYAVALAETMSRVNAVEVREGDKGCLYYPEWP